MDTPWQLIFYRGLSRYCLVIGGIAVMLYQLSTESSRKSTFMDIHYVCFILPVCKPYLLKAALLVRALTLDQHLGWVEGEKNRFNGVYFSILILPSSPLSLTVFALFPLHPPAVSLPSVNTPLLTAMSPFHFISIS